MLDTNTINLFKQSKLLCLDIETYDPKLVEEGPGTHRKDGHICGIALATKEKGNLVREYLSFTHPDTPESERRRNRAIAIDVVSQYNPKIGANIAYDCEWLEHENTMVNGKLHDVQYAEPLLNEYRRSFSLNSLATVYHLKPKKTDVLQKYCDAMGWKGKPIKHIWRMPAAVAAEYALVDVELPFDIFERQKRNLETQNLYDLYELETDLIPSILDMRRNGVRLDMPLFKRTIMQVADMHYRLKEEVLAWAGTEINLNSTQQIAGLFDKEGIDYPRNLITPAMQAKGITIGSPNLNKKVLQRLSPKYPICKKILEFRHYETLSNLFLHKYATFNVDGRLYGSFHPLRNDDYGTVSGRFSSSKPNLQQVSAKKEDVEDVQFDILKGQIIRKLFIPEEGCGWAKLDYSQVEYRIMAHYASGKGSEALRRSYIANKKMDYHQRIMDDTGFNRRTSKNVNFGGMYGIGAPTASNLFDWTMEEAELFLSTYHKNAPYIKTTRNLVSNTAARRGFIYTILGRKARTHVSRKLYSMFNRLIQGSAADVMKKAIVDARKKGLFDVLKLHITVHDELDVSYKKNKEGEEALRELHETMENTVKLDVPILVDCHTGNNWAEAD